MHTHTTNTHTHTHTHNNNFVFGASTVVLLFSVFGHTPASFLQTEEGEYYRDFFQVVCQDFLFSGAQPYGALPAAAHVCMACTSLTAIRAVVVSSERRVCCFSPFCLTVWLTLLPPLGLPCSPLSLPCSPLLSPCSPLLSLALSLLSPCSLVPLPQNRSCRRCWRQSATTRCSFGKKLALKSLLRPAAVAHFRASPPLSCLLHPSSQAAHNPLSFSSQSHPPSSSFPSPSTIPPTKTKQCLDPLHPAAAPTPCTGARR